MEGKPCVPVSSDVCKLRCNAWATKDSASNLHWPTGVASRQSGRVGGLYKEVQDRKEVRRAATAGLEPSSLSLSQRAQQQDQSEYLAWMREVCQLSPSACFREERRYRREGPLPITPEKDVVEDSRESASLPVSTGVCRRIFHPWSWLCGGCHSNFSFPSSLSFFPLSLIPSPLPLPCTFRPTHIHTYIHCRPGGQ